MRSIQGGGSRNMTHRRCGALPQNIPHFRSFLSHVRLLSGSPLKAGFDSERTIGHLPLLLTDVCWHLPRDPMFQPPWYSRIERVRVLQKGGKGAWMDGSHIYKYITDFFFSLMARIVKHPFLFFKCWIFREVTKKISEVCTGMTLIW